MEISFLLKVLFFLRKSKKFMHIVYFYCFPHDDIFIERSDVSNMLFQNIYRTIQNVMSLYAFAGYSYRIITNFKFGRIHSSTTRANLCEKFVCTSICNLMDLCPKRSAGNQHGRLFD